MGIRIIRGENQIGGTVTEVSSSTIRIWIDFGCELSVAPEESTDSKVIGEIEANPPDAVLFTHIHGDHVGLLHAVPDSVKHIYIGRVAARLMMNIRNRLLSLPLNSHEREKLEREKAILEDSSRVCYFDEGVSFTVGDITVTPYEVDHSVCDAYMFLIEAEGKTILHTGDFRNHGRLGKNFTDKLANIVAEKPVDILITEGTMMSRSGEKVMTEEQLSDKALELLKEHKYAFLICSSTNMESLASFYYATIRSGYDNGNPRTGREDWKPAFIVDSYLKEQIDVFSEEYGKNRNRKEFNFRRTYTVKEYLDGYIDKNKEIKQIEYMEQNGFLMRVNTGKYSRMLMEKLRYLNPIIIYSMWDGYLDKDKDYRNDKLIEMKEAWPGAFISLHTSGHASVELLTEVINIVNPREKIIPVHTENAKGFFELDIKPELKDRVEIKEM